MTVSGTNSKWLNSTNLYVGYAGTAKGELQIANGGVVSNKHAYIGFTNSAQGKVTVEGEGSLWTITGNLILGGTTLTNATTATGELTIADSALVTVSGTTRVHGGSSIHIDAGGTLDAGTLVSNGEVTVTGNLSAAGGITLNTGAVLLIAVSNGVDNTAAITLSGGTIQRGDGVSQTFGDLSLTADSLLDYGTGATGTLTFGTYTPSSLLTVDNFFAGNKLVFSSDFTSTINNEGFFSFDNGITYGWSGSAFTITAIPEPSSSAYVVTATLIGLMLWPMLRRRSRKVEDRIWGKQGARSRGRGTVMS